MNYTQFLQAKRQSWKEYGFKPIFIPDYLFDFQKHLVEWSLVKGRSAVFADCGTGKTPMQLVWAENVVRKTNRPVLILTPLAVAPQTTREGEKFGIECCQSRDGKFNKKIVVTNYEKLHYFNPSDFAGVVCDESSILKNFDGATKSAVTEFMKKVSYRLLCTATAAPNDYIELGTSSEALGEMGYMDMLGRFFKNDQNTCDTKRNRGVAPKWRFKKHAQDPFWRWVCSWAKAMRKPSDLGFDDNGFILPDLIEQETVIPCSRPLNGKLFVESAANLLEQRQERRMTINERCGCVAEKVNSNSSAVCWCHLNDEADLLERLIPDAKQVKGGDSDNKKEETLTAFASGQLRVLIIKPVIGAFGLNWQHCHHMTFFPSHSYEQYYQGVRRCWRFGQDNQVVVDIVTTQGELKVLKNLQRKSIAADEMFTRLIGFMNDSLGIKIDHQYNEQERIPSWL